MDGLNHGEFFGKNLLWNEQDLLKNIFALSELQRWVDELSDQVLHGGRPESGLRLSTFWNILSKNHFKMKESGENPRFTIPIRDLLAILNESLYQHRSPSNLAFNPVVVNTNQVVGYDKSGFSTCFMTIVFSEKGQICDAFPGYVPIR